jgi:DNA-binding PadR family transcriptional regulator
MNRKRHESVMSSVMNGKSFPSSTGLSLSPQLYSSNQSLVVIEVDPVWWRKASRHSKARLQHATELRRLLRVHGPLSGYDLAQQMKKRVGLMWSALPSQIYPELAKLEAQGLVTHQVVEQHDHRPDKKVYEITEAGREALRHWVTEPTPVAALRDEFLLKAYSLWLADPEQAIARFREHEQAHNQQLTEYEELLARLRREWGSALDQVDSPLFGSSIAIHYGIDYERNYVAWCRWVIEQLEQQMRSEAS